MAGFNARTGLEELEEYAVEHVAADIIVNANESNYNLPRPIEQAANPCADRAILNRITHL